MRARTLGWLPLYYEKTTPPAGSDTAGDCIIKSDNRCHWVAVFLDSIHYLVFQGDLQALEGLPRTPVPETPSIIDGSWS